MSETQLGLALPRKRVALASEAPEQAGGDYTVDKKALEAFLGLTDWETKTPPPMAGWWDITDHKTGTVDERWWFDGQLWMAKQGAPGVTHADFALVYAWRGLKAQHPDHFWRPAVKRGRVALQ